MRRASPCCSFRPTLGVGALTMLSETLGKRLYSRTFPPGATVSPPLHQLRRQHQLWSGVTNFSHPFLFGFYPIGLMSPIGFLPIGENAANGQPGGCASSSMCCAETARSLLCWTALLQLTNYRHQRGPRSSKMLSKDVGNLRLICSQSVRPA